VRRIGLRRATLPSRQPRDWIRVAVASALGLYFAASGVIKAAAPSDLVAYLGRVIPRPREVAALVVGTECAVGAGLLAGLLRGRHLWLVPILILTLTALHVAVYLLLGTRRCPCGIMEMRDLRWFLARNAVLIVLSLVLTRHGVGGFRTEP